jgi:putative DNA primase/helicase
MARWSNPASALLVAGWIFLAPICGALRWRPHIWITGPAGSGKTSIVEGYVGALLGNIGLRLDAGSSTAAGTRQTLSCDARPVILDESESDDERGRQRIAELLTIARGASSASGAKIVKGTAAGVAMDFHVRGAFCMSSIGTQLEKKADTSRFALLSLRPGVDADGQDHWPALKSKLHEIEIDTEWPGRLLARSLGMMPVLLESIRVFCDAVAEKHGGDRRVGDQFGTLLAGAWCLASCTVPTSAQVQNIVASIDWRDYLDRAEAPDADQCLRQILDGQITHKGEQTRVRTLLRVALGEVVEGLKIDYKTALRLLQDNDISITKKTHLAIAYGSTAITRMLRGTRFATDWQGHIKRATGYEALPATSFGPKGKERAHGLKLASLGLVEDGLPI